MTLRKGITGFFDNHKELNDHNVIDEKSLRVWLASVCNKVDFEILEITPPQINSNYYRVSTINKIENCKYDILFNHHYPVFCGVTTTSDWMNLSFIELPQKLVSIIEPEFNYLNKKELERNPSPNDFNELAKSEIQQIEYWKSNRIGDIIFNGYD